MHVEALARLKGIERVCLSQHGYDSHLLMLGDSLAVILAFERRRAKNGKGSTEGCCVKKEGFCYERCLETNSTLASPRGVAYCAWRCVDIS